MRRFLVVTVVIVLGILLAALFRGCSKHAYTQYQWEVTSETMVARMQGVDRYRMTAHGCPAASSIEELDLVLVPEYLVRTPQQDNWGTPLRYERWRDENGQEHCGMGAAGSDTLWEHEHLADYRASRPESLEADGVLVDGEWRQIPVGIQ